MTFLRAARAWACWAAGRGPTSCCSNTKRAGGLSRSAGPGQHVLLTQIRGDMAENLLRCTVLDDYQRVAAEYADWGTIADRVTVRVLHEHVAAEHLAELLQDDEIVVLM